MAKSFLDTAREIRGGQFLEDCADGLHAVIAAVEETGKAAKLLIEISIKPASKGQGAVILADKIKTKLPELPVGETIMFVTPENNLQRNDPRQGALPLRQAQNPTTNLKEAG